MFGTNFSGLLKDGKKTIKPDNTKFGFYTTLFSKVMSSFWWLLLNWTQDWKFFLKGLVIAFGLKGMPDRMCDIVRSKWGHTKLGIRK